MSPCNSGRLYLAMCASVAVRSLVLSPPASAWAAWRPSRNLLSSSREARKGGGGDFGLRIFAAMTHLAKLLHDVEDLRADLRAQHQIHMLETVPVNVSGHGAHIGRGGRDQTRGPGRDHAISRATGVIDNG